jgi:hypothetical protein
MSIHTARIENEHAPVLKPLSDDDELESGNDRMAGLGVVQRMVGTHADARHAAAVTCLVRLLWVKLWGPFLPHTFL